MIRLSAVRIYKYKSIQETEFKVDDRITTLVGVNESGKSAVLEAIAKGDYYSGEKFDVLTDYPRTELKNVIKNAPSDSVIKLTFRISDELMAKIQTDVGPAVDQQFSIFKDYDDDEPYFLVESNFDAFLNFKINQYKVVQEGDKDLLLKLNNSLNNAKEIQDQLSSDSGKKLMADLLKIKEGFKWNDWGDFLGQYVAEKWLDSNIPTIVYYDQYHSLPSSFDLNDAATSEVIDSEVEPVKAFLELADIKPQDILESTDFEFFVAELETTAREVTTEFVKYWSSDKGLEFKFDINRVDGSPHLNIRVKNDTDWTSISLDKRSTGFKWFFSFIVWFSSVAKNKSKRYVLLMDEPGLHLHASAQADLLRFFEDLAEQHQIIYTTHSPFMIDSSHLERVRTVINGENGTKVSDNIQDKDPNTLFPLQAALGYDLAQNLFVARDNLLVEGPADLVYLQAMSSLLESKGRQGLNPKVTIVPVGGLDKIPAFISLFRGNKLNLVCLLDSFRDSAIRQKMEDLVRHKIIREKNIKFYHEFLNVPSDEADIEDLFTKEEYLQMFNEAFPEYGGIEVKDLDENIPCIIRQINARLGKTHFNHYRPAMAMTKMRIDFGDNTLDTFERLFTEVNKLFS